jgi:hypothetical protein
MTCDSICREIGAGNLHEARKMTMRLIMELKFQVEEIEEVINKPEIK